MKQQKALTIKTLSKSNAWELQENDIFRLWHAAEKDIDLADNARHYIDVIKSAFEVEEVKVDKPEVIAKYEARGFKVGEMKTDETTKTKWALKKRAIMRITDLTYENIRHISAAKLIEVLERNFGGGWESLSQSIQDIILSGFDISTTTLPKDRLHKKGGMYETKVKNGFEVLEIEKGSWVEAIFAKEKPGLALPKQKNEKLEEDDENDDDENLEIDSPFSDDDDDSLDDDMLTEESYRTTFDADPDDLEMEGESIADDEDAY